LFDANWQDGQRTIGFVRSAWNADNERVRHIQDLLSLRAAFQRARHR
jgi:hypothetical protein